MTASSLPPSAQRGQRSRETVVTPTIEHGHGVARAKRSGTVKMTHGTGELPGEPTPGIIVTPASIERRRQSAGGDMVDA